MATGHRAVAGNATGQRIITIVFCLAVVLNFERHQSAAEPDVDLRQQVRLQIEQLGAASRVDRAQAERALIKLGPDILPLLPPPDLLPSASVRVAVRRVRVRLEHDAAEQSLDPSRVTLVGEHSVQEIVQEIKTQTGNRISTESLSTDDLEKLISLNLKAVPFWQAIARLEAAGLHASFDKESGMLTMVTTSSQTPEPESVIDRSFLIAVSPLTSKTIDGTGTLLSSQLKILCEPRLRPLFLRYSTEDFQLLQDDGRKTIEPFNRGASIEVPLGNGGREAALSLGFLADEQPEDSAALRGQVELLIAASEQPVAFREIGRSKRVTRRRGGVTVTVNEVGFEGSRPQHHNARIQLRVSYDLGAHAFESHQTWVFHNRVYLVDPAGKQHGPNGGFSTLFQGDGSVGIEYAFEDLPSDPANWEFVYVAPTLLINVEIPISLSDIPIIQSDSKLK